MRILGISAFFHDSAAALVEDGRIVAAAQEERFSRRKHDERFPAHAVAYCLREARISAAQLDAVVFYEKPLLKFERLLETALAFAPRGFPAFLRSMPPWLQRKLHLPREIDRGLGGDYVCPILFCTHHHMLFHDNGWEIRHEHGQNWLIPPPDVDPQQTPIAMRSKSAAARRLAAQAS